MSSWARRRVKRYLRRIVLALTIMTVVSLVVGVVLSVFFFAGDSAADRRTIDQLNSYLLTPLDRLGSGQRRFFSTESGWLDSYRLSSVRVAEVDPIVGLDFQRDNTGVHDSEMVQFAPDSLPVGRCAHGSRDAGRGLTERENLALKLADASVIDCGALARVSSKEWNRDGWNVRLNVFRQSDSGSTVSLTTVVELSKP